MSTQAFSYVGTQRCTHLNPPEPHRARHTEALSTVHAVGQILTYSRKPKI